MVQQRNPEYDMLLDSMQREPSRTISRFDVTRTIYCSCFNCKKILAFIVLLLLLIQIFPADSIYNRDNYLVRSYKFENEKQILLTGFILNVTQIFDKYSIPYWLDAGTALGAFRNGGVFKHEYDADITISYLPNDEESEAAFYKRVFSILKQELGSLFRLEICRGGSNECFTNWEWGSQLPPRNNKLNDIQFEICEIHRKACHNPDLDIMSSILHNGFLFRTSLINNYEYSQELHANQKDGCQECPVPFDFVFPFRRLEFGPDKVKVIVPNKIKRYLEFRYRYIGEDAEFDEQKGYYKSKNKQNKLKNPRG